MRGWMNEARIDRRAVVRSMLGLLVFATALSGVTVGPVSWNAAAVAQDGTAGAESKETPMAKRRGEPKGRLPAYFGEVIDSQQREKVYGIQSKYLAEIKQLQDQIATLEKQRDEAVQAVLTPEQAEKVKKLVDEGKAKRADATKRKKGGAAEPSANESAANRGS